MLRTLQAARGAMQFEQARIDTRANNLANVSTAGFRQVLTRVSELAGGAPSGQGSVWDKDLDLGMNQILDLQHGPLEPTGNDHDLAIAGRGFFAVNDQEGNTYYTRGGGFGMNDAGELITSDGLKVQGTGGPIIVSGGEVTVDTTGMIRVKGAERGRIKVVDFAIPSELHNMGHGRLTTEGQMEAVEVPPEEITVMQGYLEGSNVDPVRTLVDMISAQRAFEIGAKVMESNDELLGKSVNSLGRTS